MIGKSYQVLCFFIKLIIISNQLIVNHIINHIIDFFSKIIKIAVKMKKVGCFLVIQIIVVNLHMFFIVLDLKREGCSGIPFFVYMRKVFLPYVLCELPSSKNRGLSCNS